MKNDDRNWCMCDVQKLKGVARDCFSTCSICGGKDAYGTSPMRPGVFKKSTKKQDVCHELKATYMVVENRNPLKELNYLSGNCKKCGEEIEAITEPKEQDVCPDCGGKGVIMVYDSEKSTALEDHFHNVPCPTCTGKATVDKIREAFEKTDHYKNAVTEHQELERYVMFIAGYKSQQAEIERLKCCGNCGKRYYYGIDTKCDEIRFLERNGSGKCSLWCLTYQPKENN